MIQHLAESYGSNLASLNRQIPHQAIFFGGAVAIDGDYAIGCAPQESEDFSGIVNADNSPVVVGAPFESSSDSSTINDDGLPTETSPGLVGAGAAYVKLYAFKLHAPGPNGAVGSSNTWLIEDYY